MQSDTPTVFLLKLWPRIEANKNRIIGIAFIVVVLALAVGFFIWQKSQTESRASLALTQVMLAPTPVTARPPAYLKVANDFPHTKAGQRALLQAALFTFAAGKYTDAQPLFQRFLDSYSDNPLASVAQLGVAACLDAMGKTDAAAAAYQNVLARSHDDTAVAQAKFSLARIYQSQGKFNEARTAYEDVARANPYGSLGQEAGVRAEELKMQMPAPASTKPAPSSTPHQSFELFNTNAAQ